MAACIFYSGSVKTGCMILLNQSHSFIINTAAMIQKKSQTAHSYFSPLTSKFCFRDNRRRGGD
jgi:hypothetical protein